MRTKATLTCEPIGQVGGRNAQASFTNGGVFCRANSLNLSREGAKLSCVEINRHREMLCSGRSRTQDPSFNHISPGAHSGPAPVHDLPPRVDAQGLEVSRGDVLQDQLLQAQLTDQPLQLRVLRLQLL